jgi:hypothetical protein
VGFCQCAVCRTELLAISDQPKLVCKRHSGAVRSTEAGISRFLRVWSFGPSRNDGSCDQPTAGFTTISNSLRSLFNNFLTALEATTSPSLA